MGLIVAAEDRVVMDILARHLLDDSGICRCRDWAGTQAELPAHIGSVLIGWGVRAASEVARQREARASS